MRSMTEGALQRALASVVKAPSVALARATSPFVGGLVRTG